MQCFEENESHMLDGEKRKYVIMVERWLLTSNLPKIDSLAARYRKHQNRSCYSDILKGINAHHVSFTVHSIHFHTNVLIEL